MFQSFWRRRAEPATAKSTEKVKEQTVHEHEDMEAAIDINTDQFDDKTMTIQIKSLLPDTDQFDGNSRREGIQGYPVEFDASFKIKVHPKTEREKKYIKNIIVANEFLEGILKEQLLDDIIDAMHPWEVKEGDVIIKEDEPGNHLYISDAGTYEVYVSKILVNTFSDKRVFGELAMLYKDKRMATIQATTNGRIWVLHRDVYQQALVQDAVKYLEEKSSFLKNVPLVNKLSDDKLNKIAHLLRKEFFKTDTVIVQEGEKGEKFYVIRAGSVTVTKKEEGRVAVLGKGKFFGELALLYSDNRQATVVAKAPGVECLTLTRSEFLEHFDEKVLTQENESNAKKNQKGNIKKDEIILIGEYSDLELDDLDIIGTLGIGGFGRVELAQHKTKKEITFAIKYLKKLEMVQQGQVQHVFNEKNIHINCNSLFIVRLYKTFKDNKYLYFLMECCLGGDLWTFLQKKVNKRVPDADAKFYAACVLEGIVYLHERNYIYRDLKSENLLIDERGYLKLTDFGFAKVLDSEVKTFTFAGTPEYVAPEIIYNKGHDRAVDYWALGILIFELLVGKTPFRASDDHMKTYNRILKGINYVLFPPHVTRSAMHIVTKLCKSTPTERLGAKKNGIQDIRNHKWFHGFDWSNLRDRKLPAPFVPILSSNIDVKYFEKFQKDVDSPPDEPETLFDAF